VCLTLEFIGIFQQFQDFGILFQRKWGIPPLRLLNKSRRQTSQALRFFEFRHAASLHFNC
jgi:hypothetical protein